MNSLLQPVATALLGALGPLADALADETGIESLLERYGWRATVDGGNVAAVGTAFGLDLIGEARTVASQLATSPDNPAALVGQLAQSVPAIIDHIHLLADGHAGLDFAPFSTPGFWSQFTADLVNGLLADWLEARQPLISGLLALTGLIERQQVPAAGPGRISYEQTVIRWDHLGDLVTNPGHQLASTYRWADPANPFDHDRLLRALERILIALGVPATRDAVRPALAPYYQGGQVPAGLRELAVPLLAGVPLDQSGYLDIGLVIAPVPPMADRSKPPDGLVGYPVAQGYQAQAIPLGGGFSLTLSGGFDASGAVTAEVHPGSAGVTTSDAVVDARAALAGRPVTPWVLIGTRGGPRVEVPGLLLSVRVHGPLIDPEVILTFATSDAASPPPLALIVDFGDAASDDFLRSVFGSGKQKLDVGATVAWSNKTGLSLQAAAGLKLAVPVNRTLGAITVTEIDVILQAAETGAAINLTASGTVVIGPLQATADKVGARFALTPRAAGGPAETFGDVGVAFGFKPPDGIGLALDSSLVTGTGYLFTDPAGGLYAGAASLQLEGIGIAAVGLLAARLPGGQAGYSLVLLVSVTFPPIELGFGFALTGVGGLIAVNRTVNVTALQAGLAGGSLGAVLFPADLASHAQRVVTGLEQYFPAAPGQFVIGPAVQISWGEDGIFVASIGVYVEFPNPLRVVLLGRLDVALPTAGEAIAEIELDVLGVVDFTAKTLGLDAVLRNSHVACFPLTGAAALRASWGAQPGFLFAAGGFNPRFAPPVSFPRLDPLALSLSTSDNPRLRVSAYLAVTSNTVQVGGQLDFSAQVGLLLGTLGVAASLGIDTLFQLRPFEFFVDLHAMVAITWNGSPVLSAQLDGTFTGPSPLYLAATATVHFLGTHRVHAELTIPGDGPPPAIPPPPVDAAAELRDALGQPSAWHSDPPPGGQHLVRLAGPSGQGGNVLVHPLGVLTVRQRRMPLGQAIRQLGSEPLAAPATFTIAGATIGQAVIENPPAVQDYFARAQFFPLSDADKLSAPSFELMDAGVALSSADTEVAGGQVTVTASFTSITVPAAGGQAAVQSGKVLPDSLLAACARAAAAGRPGALAASYLGNPAQVTLTPPAYVLATSALTSPEPGQPPRRFATYSQAASQRAAGEAAGTQVVFADELVTWPATPARPTLVPPPPVTGIISPIVPPSGVPESSPTPPVQVP